MRTTNNAGYHVRNHKSNRHSDKKGNMRTSVRKGAGAVVVAVGFLLLLFDGFHPLLLFVWSSFAVSVLWSFKREEARYMDELARGVRMNHKSLVKVESTAQSHEMDWHGYDSPLWEGWGEGYLIVWV